MEVINNRTGQGSLDRIDGNCIVIDGQGNFPKTLKIRQDGETKEYVLRKTGKGKFILNGK